MVLEFQRAHGVGHALDRIRLPMRIVVHRVDAPLAAGAVMVGVQDAVHDRIAHVEIGRRHVNLGTQNAGAVGKLALSHALEEIEIFFRRATTVRTLFAGLGERAAMLANLFGAQIVDVGFAVFDQLDRPFVELAKVVGGVAEIVPLEAEPVHVFHDGVDVLLLFFFGIGVVEAEIGLAAEFVGESEVEADGFGVADVQIAVRLRRKARLDDRVAVFFGFQILDHRIADEVGGTRLGGRAGSGLSRRRARRRTR